MHSAKSRSKAVPNTVNLPVERAGPRLLVERPISESGNGAHAGKPRRTVTVNLAESPLSWLHAHGHLTDRQLLAGETLRGDYEKACLGPRVTMTWDGAPVARGKRGAPTPFTPTELALNAKQRFDGAVSVLGRDLGDIAWRVICAGETVPVAEKSLGWPLRSGKLVLRIALDRLAEHYRIPG